MHWLLCFRRKAKNVRFSVISVEETRSKGANREGQITSVRGNHVSTKASQALGKTCPRGRLQNHDSVWLGGQSVLERLPKEARGKRRAERLFSSKTHLAKRSTWSLPSSGTSTAAIKMLAELPCCLPIQRHIHPRVQGDCCLPMSKSR